MRGAHIGVSVHCWDETEIAADNRHVFDTDSFHFGTVDIGTGSTQVHLFISSEEMANRLVEATQHIAASYRTRNRAERDSPHALDDCKSEAELVKF